MYYIDSRGSLDRGNFFFFSEFAEEKNVITVIIGFKGRRGIIVRRGIFRKLRGMVVKGREEGVMIEDLKV